MSQTPDYVTAAAFEIAVAAMDWLADQVLNSLRPEHIYAAIEAVGAGGEDAELAERYLLHLYLETNDFTSCN